MTGFTFPPKVYNFIKYLVLIVLPAVSTLWVILANAWNWDYMTNVSVTLTAVTAFLGRWDVRRLTQPAGLPMHS